MIAPELVPADPVEQQVLGALRRAAVYRLLAAAFAYPTVPRLTELADLSAARAADGIGGPEVGRGLAAFAGAARQADPAAVADEYVFLFDRQPRCPPYEGAYGAAAQMAGKSAELADIAGFYTAFGLTPAATQPDLEDHIAAELEFMSVLATKEAYAMAEGAAEGVEVLRRAQVSFLSDHLGRWAESFAADLVPATPLPYYTAAAALLAGWVRAEIDALGATPDRAAVCAPGDEEGAFSCPVAPESEGSPGENPG
jgi:DMSO reductase family type II enzyme chaperone